MTCPYDCDYCSPGYPCLNCLSERVAEEALWELRIGLPDEPLDVDQEDYEQVQEFYAEDLRDCFLQEGSP
jgi:hypothetical protein